MVATRESRVLVVGLDAADPGIIRRFAAAGDLPVLGALLRTSTSVAVTNPPGLYEGAVWPSFATGTSPARHRRYSFRQFDPATYGDRLVAPEDIVGDPFWRAADAAGLATVVFDPPKSRHLSGFGGVQVCDWGTHDLDYRSPRSTPSDLIDQIHRRFGRDPVGSCDLPRSRPEQYRAFLERLVERVHRREAIAAWLLSRRPWRLAVVAFTESHCVGHQCWHLHDPGDSRHDATIAARLGDPLRTVYAAIDAAVGRLAALAGDDDLVLLWASHGMGRGFDGTPLVDGFLRRIDGLPAAPGRGIELLRRAWRRLPEPVVRRLSNLGSRASARLESRWLAPDRRRRRVFAVPNNDVCGGVRVNLEGREAAGLVSPGGEYEQLLARVRVELLNLVDLESGERAVGEVWRTTELYRGPFVDELPDLLIDWNRDVRGAALSSPRLGTLVRTGAPLRSGDHLPQGLLLARGPGLPAGPLAERVGVEDLAPTVAAWLGIDLPDVDGRPIAGLRRLFAG